MLYTQVQQSRVLINSAPSGGPLVLAKIIEIFGYQAYANSDNYVIGTPKSFNYKETKRALEQNKKAYYSEDSSEKIGVGGLSPSYVDLSTFWHWLDVIPLGQYILGHISWTPTLSPILADLNYHHMFIIREPHTVVASLLSFILATGTSLKHFLADDFKPMSPNQRLSFILEGGYAPQAGVEVKNFAEVYRSMLAWRNEPGCLFVRFEDLVGEQEGGTIDRQINVIESIASHLGIPFDDQILAKFKEIYNTSSQALRTNKIDSWNSWDVTSIECLNEYCQPLCQEAGYEVSTTHHFQSSVIC